MDDYLALLSSMSPATATSSSSAASSLEMTAPPSSTEPAKEYDVYSAINVPYSGSSNKFCLVLMVRQEEPIIRRCLTALNHLFDTFVICDTGSTDNTLEVMHEWMTEHGKSGYLIKKAWKNFGVNKSYGLRMAYEQNLSQSSQYIIFLDADEVFIDARVDEDAPEESRYFTEEGRKDLVEIIDARPNVGIFYIKTHYGSSRYYRWNILRNNQLYVWYMPVQEVLEATKPCDNYYIDEKFMYLWARKQGCSSRIDRTKWEFDELTEYIEMVKDPTHPEHRFYDRAVFYLGQVGEWYSLDDGIKAYDLRLTLGGNWEEKFIARLRLARIYRGKKKDESGSEEKAIKYLKDAIQIYPHRLEAYYELMRLYDRPGSRHEAYKVAIAGIKALKVPEQSLFVENSIYDYQFCMWAGAICGQEDVKKYSMAYFFTDKALCGDEYDKEKHDQMMFNLKWAEDRIASQNIDQVVANEVCLKSEIPMLAMQAAKPATIYHKHIPKVVVIDNFMTPAQTNALRDFALKQSFDVKGNFPGSRTKSFATDLMKNTFEQILGKRITYWPTDHYNGSFQICMGEHKSWIHRDKTDYSAIIYLTPNAPMTGGTDLYQNKTTKLFYETPETVDYLNNKSQDYDDWVKACSVGNVYGRLIIINGKSSHQSGEYFGQDIQGARLMQIFFFNVETDPADTWKLNKDKP